MQVLAPLKGELWADAARRQGTEARLAGRPYSTCPYPGFGTLQRLWRDAWTKEDNALRSPNPQLRRFTVCVDYDPSRVALADLEALVARVFNHQPVVNVDTSDDPIKD